MTRFAPSVGASIAAGQSKKEALTGVARRTNNMLSKTSHGKVCQARVPDEEVALFAAANYNCRFKSTGYDAANCLTETGAGRDSAKKCFLYPTWMWQIKWYRFFKMGNANKQLLRSEGVTIMHRRIRQLYVKVRFIDVDNLADDGLLETSFFDRSVRGTLHVERNLVPIAHIWWRYYTRQHIWLMQQRPSVNSLNTLRTM